MSGRFGDARFFPGEISIISSKKLAAFLWLAAFAGARTVGLSAAGPARQDLESFRDRVDKVIDDYTVQSLIGPIRTPLSMELADFFLEHIDLSVVLLNRLKLAPYSVSMRGPDQFLVDDGDGSTGIVTLVERNAERRVYYIDGTNVSRPWPTLHAAAVVFFDIRPDPDADCGRSIESSFTVYVRLRNTVLSDLIKPLRPFIRNTVARKFTKGFMAAHELGRLTAENQSRVMEQLQDFPSAASEDRASLLSLMSRLGQAPASCSANRQL